MKNKTVFVVFSIISICLIQSCHFLKRSDRGWKIESKATMEVSYIDFIWTDQILNGKLYRKTAILIPARISGVSNVVSFQFDIGANISMLYEKPLASFFGENNELRSRLKPYKFPFYFSKRRKLFDHLEISIGDYDLQKEDAYVLGGYGNTISPQRIADGDTIHIGSIGVDMFADKVLIIDYREQKLAICEQVPSEFEAGMMEIEFDNAGRPILPLRMNSKDFRVLFDSGSSLFPLICSSERIGEFTSQPVTDSIEISAWGKKHIVHGRMMLDSFDLAGQRYGNVKIYENHTNYGLDKNTDAIAGNNLFWDSKLILDFKDKRFSVVEY